MRKAFTLIELLIVVAIIAILAAIAVPNFLDAQARSKISKAKADMRSIAVALQAYMVDNMYYPFHRLDSGRSWLTGEIMYDATTPIAYITRIPRDPFATGRYKYNAGVSGHADPKTVGAPYTPDYWTTFHYQSVNAHGYAGATPPTRGFIIISMGPDIEYGVDIPGVGWYQTWWLLEGFVNQSAAISGEAYGCIYNATNGTNSVGDIIWLTGAMGLPDGIID